MKDRIKKIMEMQHVTQQDFADQLNVGPATLSNIFTGRTRPTLAIVDAIKNRFPQISTDWLMFGKGKMYVSDSPTSSDGSGVDSNECEKNIGLGTDGEMSHGMVDVLGSKQNTQQRNVVGMVADSCSDECQEGLPRGVNTNVSVVKKCDITHQRRIVEIRVFYDDQTWETFVPKQ